MLPAPRMFLLAATNSSQHLSRPSQMPLSLFSSRLSTGLRRALGPVRIACMCLHTVLRLRVSQKYRMVRMNNEASGCAGSLCDCVSTGQVGDTGDRSNNADDVWEEVGGSVCWKASKLSSSRTNHLPLNASVVPSFMCTCGWSFVIDLLNLPLQLMAAS